MNNSLITIANWNRVSRNGSAGARVSIETTTRFSSQKLILARVFRSKPFLFLIGEDQSEYHVQAGIIAQQSKALKALVSGTMSEASEGKATFEDVTNDTFERFCQFAYTGDYTTPEFKTAVLPPSDEASKRIETKVVSMVLPVVEPHESQLLEDTWGGLAVPKKSKKTSKKKGGFMDQSMAESELLQEEENNGWGSFAVTKKSKQTAKLQALRQTFEAFSFNTDRNDRVADLCAVRQNTCASEDYTPVFLSHAHLYVFADKWGITDLKQLALFKLHQTLRSFTLYAARRPDIVELLRFAYDNTPDCVDDVDELRSLLMCYVGYELEGLNCCEEFVALVVEGGDITRDVFRVMMKRII